MIDFMASKTKGVDFLLGNVSFNRLFQLHDYLLCRKVRKTHVLRIWLMLKKLPSKNKKSRK